MLLRCLFAVVGVSDRNYRPHDQKPERARLYFRNRLTPLVNIINLRRLSLVESVSISLIMMKDFNTCALERGPGPVSCFRYRI